MSSTDPRLNLSVYADAEGNGDSISAALQAERIALLAGVLNKAEPSPVPQRQQSLPATLYPREVSGPWQDDSLRVSPRHEMPTRSQSVYSSAGGLFAEPPIRMDYLAHPTVSKKLLPGFLQDIVEAPALSPAGSTSSSETGLEDSFAAVDISDRFNAPRMQRYPYSTSSSSSVSSASISSIWKLDGEESKHFGLGNVSPIEKAPTAFTSYA